MRYLLHLVLHVVLLSLFFAGLTGCGFFHDAGAQANYAVHECGKGELAKLRPVAIALVKPLLAGTITQDDLTTTAIQAGEEFGGCLLAHLNDVIPRPQGFEVGTPSEPELALQKFREVTKTTAKYRTDGGTL